jgi:glycosyltransferase involved in cell wall biosynthesis
MPLRIVGDGPDLSRLQAISGPDVTFLGSLSDEHVRSMYQRATAVLLPGTEDFGIAPVEAQACGRPVIALDAGGASETVNHKDTGILVDEPTTSAFADAIRRVKSMQFNTRTIREHAIRYSRERFKTAMRQEVAQLMTAPVSEFPNDAS